MFSYLTDIRAVKNVKIRFPVSREGTSSWPLEAIFPGVDTKCSLRPRLRQQCNDVRVSYAGQQVINDD